MSNTKNEVKTSFSFRDFMNENKSQRGGEASIYKSSAIAEICENGKTKKQARKMLRDFFVKSCNKWKKDKSAFDMQGFKEWCKAVYIGNVFYSGSEISEKDLKDFTAEILKK